MAIVTRSFWRVAPIVALVAIVVMLIWRTLSAPMNIDDIAERFLTTHDIPGAVIGIAVPGQPYDIRAYGLADQETARPMQIGDRFRLASLSKPVTATVVQRLIASDPELDLDMPLAKGFREFGEVYDKRMMQITLRHLLQHSAGWDWSQDIDPFFLEAKELNQELKLRLQQLESCVPIANAMLEHSLQTDPGVAYSYSNIGYCWLELWIVHQTGERYELAAKALVPEIRSLSLNNDVVTVTHHGLSDEPDMAVENPNVMAAAGGWIGSAADYLPFAAAPIGSAVFSKPDYAEGEQYYGLGWRVWDRANGPFLTHYGAMPGVFSVVVRNREGATIVALFNGRPADDLSAFLSLFEELQALAIFDGKARK
ncbi:MAG: serine hydrolase domain-containing protein [Pseudomonadota bacterium]